MNKAVEEEVEVLFVEDDPAVGEIYKLKLELDGYRVTLVDSAEEGLKQVRKRVPDIVYLDMRLPNMRSRSMLKELRADSATRDIPVIILAEHENLELAANGLELGAADYLVKAESGQSRVGQDAQRWLNE